MHRYRQQQSVVVSKETQHRRSLDEDDEENSSTSTADSDIYDRIAILAKEYGHDFSDDDYEDYKKHGKHYQKNTEYTPTSETNDPFSEDDYRDDSEDQQELQMKVQTRKALKDSKKFLHTSKKMETKMNISNNQSVLSNAFLKEKNETYEATIRQIASKDNWILTTSFDKCFEKIRKQIMTDVFSRERLRNRVRITEPSHRKSVTKAPNKERGPPVDLQQHKNYDDIPLPTNNRRNFDKAPIRVSETKEAKEPIKRKQIEEQRQPVSVVVPQKEKSKRKSKPKITIEPYEASESEFHLLEGFFGSKMALNILSVGSVLVRFQKFWRANRKFTRNKVVLDLREMWRTTVFEMERAENEKLDISEYKRQLKYFASQFCKEMAPQKPYMPGGKKPSTKDKHSFLHRKQQPVYLKNMQKKKLPSSKTSTPATPPDTPTPNNMSPPDPYATPVRSPPKPKEDPYFTPPSQSPRRDSSQNDSNESNFTTPKKSKGISRTLSSRVFRLENRMTENTPLSEQEPTPYKDVAELNLTEGGNSHIINLQSSPARENSPRKTPVRDLISPDSTTNQSLHKSLNNSTNETKVQSPKSKPPSPINSFDNEANTNTYDMRPISPIMRKAPPPPISIFANNSQENSDEDLEEYQYGQYEQEHYDSMTDVDEHDLDEKFDYSQENSINNSLEHSITHDQNSPNKGNIFDQKTISPDNSKIEEINNTTSISNSSNIRRFSATYREEEDKKKAEDLYNNTTGTLSGLLIPRNVNPTENVQSPKREQPNTDDENNFKSISTQKENLSPQSSPGKIPKPPSRKPPQPTLSLEESMERDRARFAELESLCFSVDESSIVYQFDKEYVFNELV